jgi:pilus assembly protein CpaB
MKTRRVLLAIAVALAISVTLTLWLSKTISKAGASHSSDLQYVVTTRKIEAGEVLKSEDLGQRNWPASDPLTGAFTSTKDVLGRAVRYSLAAGEPIQDGQLAPAGSGIGLSERIPSGMRAMSLRSDEIVGVAGFLAPGAHVDVLVTTANSASPLTSIVLQDVEVLATGQKMEPDPNGKATPVGVVTLLVSPRDAEKAVLASAQGKIHFILRNASDSNQQTVSPVLMTELSPRAEPTAPPRRTVIVQRPVAAPPVQYSIEVVAGDHATTETFH